MKHLDLLFLNAKNATHHFVLKDVAVELDAPTLKRLMQQLADLKLFSDKNGFICVTPVSASYLTTTTKTVFSN